MEQQGLLEAGRSDPGPAALPTPTLCFGRRGSTCLALAAVVAVLGAAGGLRVAAPRAADLAGLVEEAAAWRLDLASYSTPQGYECEDNWCFSAFETGVVKDLYGDSRKVPAGYQVAPCAEACSGTAHCRSVALLQGEDWGQGSCVLLEVDCPSRVQSDGRMWGVTCRRARNARVGAGDVEKPRPPPMDKKAWVQYGWGQSYSNSHSDHWNSVAYEDEGRDAAVGVCPTPDMVSIEDYREPHGFVCTKGYPWHASAVRKSPCPEGRCWFHRNYSNPRVGMHVEDCAWACAGDPSCKSSVAMRSGAFGSRYPFEHGTNANSVCLFLSELHFESCENNRRDYGVICRKLSLETTTSPPSITAAALVPSSRSLGAESTPGHHVGDFSEVEGFYCEEKVCADVATGDVLPTCGSDWCKEWKEYPPGRELGSFVEQCTRACADRPKTCWSSVVHWQEDWENAACFHLRGVCGRKQENGAKPLWGGARHFGVTCARTRRLANQSGWWEPSHTVYGKTSVSSVTEQSQDTTVGVEGELGASRGSVEGKVAPSFQVNTGNSKRSEWQAQMNGRNGHQAWQWFYNDKGAPVPVDRLVVQCPLPPQCRVGQFKDMVETKCQKCFPGGELWIAGGD